MSKLYKQKKGVYSIVVRDSNVRLLLDKKLEDTDTILATGVYTFSHFDNIGNGITELPRYSRILLSMDKLLYSLSIRTANYDNMFIENTITRNTRLVQLVNGYNDSQLVTDFKDSLHEHFNIKMLAKGRRGL